MRHRLVSLLFGLAFASSAAAETTLLNVSYDVMRDFYRDYNPLFAKQYEAAHHDKIAIQQSHGGSSKQARAVIDGLDADVVTMNQSLDIDMIAAKGKLLRTDWASRFPNDSAPFSSLQVLIVRKGNPKGIRSWSDLARSDVSVIVPNPKTSGNGRYTYLALWGYALKQPGGDEAKARALVAGVFRNIPVLDSGGRAATTTFLERGIGDVLVTFENEAGLVAKEFGQGGFEVVYPAPSIRADLPVAVVDTVVDKKGARQAAEEYLRYLWSPAGQELAAAHFLHPRDAAVIAKHADRFPAVTLFGVEEFGGWAQAQKTHFDDGGVYDQIAADIAKLR